MISERHVTKTLNEAKRVNHAVLVHVADKEGKRLSVRQRRIRQNSMEQDRLM